MAHRVLFYIFVLLQIRNTYHFLVQTQISKIALQSIDRVVHRIGFKIVANALLLLLHVMSLLSLNLILQCKKYS